MNNPICPVCNEVMTRAMIVLRDSRDNTETVVAWICDCWTEAGVERDETPYVKDRAEGLYERRQALIKHYARESGDPEKPETIHYHCKLCGAAGDPGEPPWAIVHREGCRFYEPKVEE